MSKTARYAFGALLIAGAVLAQSEGAFILAAVIALTAIITLGNLLLETL